MISLYKIAREQSSQYYFITEEFVYTLAPVAASSAAWGWLFPTIPKACCFEAATQLTGRETVDSPIIRYQIARTKARIPPPLVTPAKAGIRKHTRAYGFPLSRE